MKFQRYTILSLVVILAFFLSTPVQAQGKAKGKEKIEQAEKGKQKKDEMSSRGKAKSKEMKVEAVQEIEAVEINGQAKVEEIKAVQDQDKPGKSKKEKVDKLDKAQSKAEAVGRDGEVISINDEELDKPMMDKEKPNNGNGNAYGKDKGDLEGREFGQARAAAAKEKQQKVEGKAEEAVVQSVALQQTAQQKLTRAREELEKARQSGKYTEAQLDQRAAAIDRAEAAANNLEQATKKTKEKVTKD